MLVFAEVAQNLLFIICDHSRNYRRGRNAQGQAEVWEPLVGFCLTGASAHPQGIVHREMALAVLGVAVSMVTLTGRTCFYLLAGTLPARFAWVLRIDWAPGN